MAPQVLAPQPLPARLAAVLAALLRLLAALVTRMFKIVPNPTFTCTVRLSVPGTDLPQAVQVTFRHKTARELDAWLRSARERASDADYLHEVIASWSGIAGADDKPLPYSREALAALLDAYPAAGAELVLAYKRQLADARAGN